VIRARGLGLAELPVEARWCSGDTLFGGALLAALVEAGSDAAALPLLSLSATFVARAHRPGTVDLAIDRFGTSRSLVPVRTTATQDDAVVATASSVHGTAPSGRVGRPAPPAVRGPDDSPPRTYQLPVPGSISDELDVRVAGAAADDLRCQVWARWPAAGAGPMRPAVLALLSDHLPFAPRLLLGDEWSGTTLDASLRVLPGLDDIAADAWVLLDMAFDLLGDLAHGTVWLWSADQGPGAPTVPLAIGAQTLRIRRV
jgi:acyl-CoA thioesterase